jgi:hypothetical protein
MVHFGNIISTLLSYDAIFFQQLIEKNNLNGFLSSFVFDVFCKHGCCYFFVIRSGRRGRDRMVVGFTTTCTISIYHHYR